MSYKGIILRVLRDLRDENPNGGWKHEYELSKIHTKYGWIGSRGERDVRDMIKDGRIEASFDGKYRIVRYKYPLPEKTGIERARELAEMGAL